MPVKSIKSAEGLNIERAMKSLKNTEGKIGFFEKSQYEDGTPVAEVAAKNEYGDPAHHVPPRSFMRTTFAEKRQAWLDILRNGAKSVLTCGITAKSVFELGLQRAVGDIKRKISKIYEPPLSKRTIENRLRKRANKKLTKSLTKPLIDTGVMLNSVTYEVNEK